MWVLDVISRVVHVGTAIVLAGGSVFLLAVLLPATRELSESTRESFSAAITPSMTERTSVLSSGGWRLSWWASKS